MKAMVLAMAATVSESAFGQLWRQIGAMLDVVIPIVLLITIAVLGGAILFGFVH